MNDGVLSAPSSNKVDAGGVKEEPAARSSVACSPVARSSAARSFVARPFVVPSSDAPNPVSYRVRSDGPRVEMRMVGSHWVEPDPISHEFSAWYKPSIRRPVVLSRSPSLDVGSPSAGNARHGVSDDEDDRLHIDRLQHPGVEDLVKPQFDDVLVQSYGYAGNGRQQLPPCTPLFNKFACVVPAGGLGSVASPVRLRNIRIARPAIADRLHVGEVARFESRTFIHNLGGRKSNTWCSTLRVKNAHHQGRSYFAPGCNSNPPLPKHCRIVYIDTCKLRGCSIDSVAFHSFVWPRNVKEAKGIARTLFTNHCNWADVLVVRGRCFSSNKVCLRANRALENLLWNWSKMRRPYVVYKEGCDDIVGSDPVLAWLRQECVHQDFCQCNLVGSRHPNWHYPGSLFSNVISRRHQLFENRCGCSHIQWPFPLGCNRNTKNVEIAIKLARVMMHVLTDIPLRYPKEVCRWCLFLGLGNLSQNGSVNDSIN